VTRWKSTGGKNEKIRKGQIYDAPQMIKNEQGRGGFGRVRTQAYILQEAGINSGLKDTITRG